MLKLALMRLGLPTKLLYDWYEYGKNRANRDLLRDFLWLKKHNFSKDAIEIFKRHYGVFPTDPSIKFKLRQQALDNLLQRAKTI